MGLPVCGLPSDNLPQCWSDDVRMNALFAPFRLKTVNPESWDMKMKFWSDMLRQWCRYKREPIVSAADAKGAFQRKGRTPACIDIVVEEMFRNGELSPISKYQQILHNGPETWMKWGARLAFKPAAFALSAMVSLLPARQALDNNGLPKASIDSTQRFVVESVIKEQATELLEKYPAGVERIGTVEELMQNCEYKQSRESFELLLGWLVSQGSAVKKGDVVKLAEADKKACVVTETEEALVRLCGAERRLEAEAARLARDAGAAAADARAALQLGNKMAAKNNLRRKHKLSARLERCNGALENVRRLLASVREMHQNADIIDTYKTSAEAMKRGMKESGLEEDAVHDTLDDLQEVMQSYNEVEKAIYNASLGAEEFDQAELEQELKELLGGPGAPGGGTPGKQHKRDGTLATPTKPERDFIFDGEERMLAELNELDIEDTSLGEEEKAERAEKREKEKEKEKKKAVPVAEGWTAEAETESKPAAKEKEAEEERPESPRPSKPWYPPSEQCLSTWTNNNQPAHLDEYAELRQDDRLHPGQPLQVEYSSPPRHYGGDFAVRDHRAGPGVWLFNADANANPGLLANSTEYFSSESPGKSGSSFQMAPGGERRKPSAWPGEDAELEDIERRLKNLRGYNL